MDTHLSQEVIDRIKSEVELRLEDQRFPERIRRIERKEFISGWLVLLCLFIGSLAGSFFLLLTFPAADAVKNANRWDDADRKLYLECMRDTESGTLPVDGDRHEWCIDFVNVGFSEK